jgi:hypothetical protein
MERSHMDLPAPGNDEPGQADSADRRERDRLPALVPITCVVCYDQTPNVWLIDISQTGCRLFARAGVFRDGEEVFIVRPDGERHRGEIAWVSGQNAGVQFDFVLPQLAFKRLLTASGTVDRPTRDVERLVDQFGRKVAPLEPLARPRQP